MKKTSVFFTILLVISLVFAVSCPNNKASVKITSPTGDDAKISVTASAEAATKEVVVELTADTFNEQAFNVIAGSETDLSSWFTSSDNTKATVSAKIKTNGLEEASTTKADEAKKYVKATVVLTVTPVAATAENTPVKVAFKIPAVTGEAKKWTTSGSELTTENDIAITVNPKLTDVTATANNVQIKYDKATEGVTNDITLVGATWKNANPSLATTVTSASKVFDACTYERKADTHICTVTLKRTSGTFSADNAETDTIISIPESELEVEEGYKLPNDFNVTFKVASVLDI